MSSPHDVDADADVDDSPLPPPPQSFQFRTPPRKAAATTIALSDGEDLRPGLPRSFRMSRSPPNRQVVSAVPTFREATASSTIPPPPTFVEVPSSPTADAPIPSTPDKPETQLPPPPQFREASVSIPQEASDSSSRKRPLENDNENENTDDQQDKRVRVGESASDTRAKEVDGDDDTGVKPKENTLPKETATDTPALLSKPDDVERPVSAPTIQDEGPVADDVEDNADGEGKSEIQAADSAKKTIAVEDKDEGDDEDEDDSDEEKPLDKNAMAMRDYERITKHGPAAIRRYEQYRRSDLKNAKVKRVLQAYNPSLSRVSEQYIIAVKGLAKMFVGDVTEAALKVREELGQSGPLLPSHLREAFRQIRRKGMFPSTEDKTLSFS